MAGGNGSTGKSRKAILIQLPPELVVLLDIEVISKRYRSRQQAIQILLETHPALVELAEKVYTAVNAQAPRSL